MHTHRPRRFVSIEAPLAILPRKLAQGHRFAALQKRQHDPVAHALAAVHSLGQHRTIAQRQKVGDAAFRVCLRVHHDELFLRARHRNVQHTQLLGLRLAPQRALERLPCDRRDVPLRVHAHRPQPELRMHEHRTQKVHIAEATREVREDHDRKFEALRLVDRHDANARRGVRGLHRTRLAFGKLLAQRAHKVEKPLPP